MRYNLKYSVSIYSQLLSIWLYVCIESELRSIQDDEAKFLLQSEIPSKRKQIVVIEIVGLYSKGRRRRRHGSIEERG
jgi:hypothetical protein